MNDIKERTPEEQELEMAELRQEIIGVRMMKFKEYETFQCSGDIPAEWGFEDYLLSLVTKLHDYIFVLENFKKTQEDHVKFLEGEVIKMEEEE